MPPQAPLTHVYWGAVLDVRRQQMASEAAAAALRATHTLRILCGATHKVLPDLTVPRIDSDVVSVSPARTDGLCWVPCHKVCPPLLLPDIAGAWGTLIIWQQTRVESSTRA